MNPVDRRYLILNFLYYQGISYQTLTRFLKNFPQSGDSTGADILKFLSQNTASEKETGILRLAHIQNHLEMEIQQVEASSQLHFIGRENPLFPARLKELPYFGIYVKGDLEILIRLNQQKSLGIVGSRKASLARQAIARQAAQILSANHFIIVSGGALGIDTNAHLGASQSGQRHSTLIVFGSGLHFSYPPQNERFFEKIVAARQGAILSQFPLQTPPEKRYFPIRNKMIAALSDSIFVVAAAEKSGAIITALAAFKLGKRVYYWQEKLSVVPAWDRGGKLLDPNRASSILKFSELFQALGVPWQKSVSPSQDLTPDEHQILNLIAAQKGVGIYGDELAQRTGLSLQAISAALLHLEIKNLIQKEINGRFMSAQQSE